MKIQDVTNKLVGDMGQATYIKRIMISNQEAVS